MTSPSMVHRSGDTLVVRSVVSGNQLFTSDNEHEPETDTEDIDYCDEYFDPDDNKNLPECKIRRNYSCVTCHFFTQNPRHYLYHLRDVHKEKVKIYECSNCLYASKHFQKLLRHVKMVHAATDAAEIVETQHRQKVRRKRKRPAADVEPPDEDDEELLDNEDAVLNGGDDDLNNKSASDLKCSLCTFTTKHQGQLTRHEKQEHIKTKFFRCSKCSYVTHIKARFTKHVKYHSMPMIKCDLCDFRTPYKWNLDRHYKNHNGHGAFRCSACNFTADIKQSLTVHEMNHHVPPVGQAAGLGVGRRRNKVGASDTTAAEEAAAAAANTISGDTLTTMPSGLTISGQPRDFSRQQNAEHHIDTTRKNPKLKISLKKFKATTTQEQNERHNFDTDFINPDDIISHSNGNIYIKNKCKLCNYKTAWSTEMAKHERKVHNIVRDSASATPIVKKTPRPIPNLIPIQPTQNQQTISANSLLKMPIINNQTSVPFGGHIIPRLDEYNPPEPESIISQKDLNDMCAKSANSALKDFASLFGGEEVMFGNEKTGTTISALPQPAEVNNTAVFKKKNASFFDKLKEKLMTGENCNLTCKWCGHESKCLSESAGHQKTCGKQQTRTSTPTPVQNVTSSTRCQHCRQRCKSSIDLHNHLQVCNKLNDSYVYNEKPDITIKLEEEPIHEDSLEPHPMENVVFVWNNISPQPPEELDRSDELSMDLSIRVRTPESESSLMECENIAESISSTPVKMPTHGTDIDQITDGRRVFKCPHCSFWATTASRFHVHIVGHLNKKPFECSLCAYRSNWRWDITKHIRLKSVRDPEHEKARVLMTDETGRRNYSKYNKYLTQLRSNDSSSQDSNSAARKAKSAQIDGSVSLELPKLTRAPNSNDFQIAVHGNNPLRPPPPLKAANEVYFQSYGEQTKRRSSSDSKKTLFKCKKCNFRDASRENILSHVKGHYRQDNNNMNMNMNMNMNIASTNCNMNMNNVPGNAESDEASVSRGQAPFRCGHCHQVSNWKHVIQRHCRLKHSGDVRVVIGGKNGVTEKIEVDDQTDEPDHMDVIQNGVFKCKNCPFSIDSQQEFDHHLEMHIPKNDSTMKCYFCPYYVTQKYELFDHLRLHGVTNPEDYVNRAMQGRELTSPSNFDGGSSNQTFKRYKCVCCPYVSNSKSQFLYHKQFHRHRGGSFKCEFCSYNVTRRHLLHQHLKVHGVNLPTQKSLFKTEPDSDINGDDYFGLDEIEEEIMPLDEQQQQQQQLIIDDQQILLDVPLVWVSKDGKFSKMFKCRFCPHVNMRKVNIQEHEKMHSLRERNPNSPRQNDEHHCTECSYICNNAGVLSSHLKVHQMVHGQIHCLVDTNKSDEEQISELTRLLNVTHKSESSDEKEFFSSDDQDFRNYEDMSMSGEKMLYFCENCPARFLHEKELHIHSKFHGIRLFYRCDYCNYAARQRPHLLSHEKVHTEDYQDKTKFYLSEYPICPNTPQPKTVVIFDSPSENKAPIWVVISTSSNVDLNDNNEDLKEFNQPINRQSNKAFGCRKCPARFFKNDALKYHMTLHGCSNPYRCKYCDYAARTSSNLQKHHRVHEEVEHFRPTPIKHVPSTSVPISGTDLFEQRNEAQRLSQNELRGEEKSSPPQQMHIDPQFGTLVNGNPKFVYPTCLRNGRMKEKRYKCHKCPSAFEKREQYKVHLSLHGSNQKYNCENCDYSVKYYANYVQHIRKHEMNNDVPGEEDASCEGGPPFSKLAIKSLSTTPPKQQRGPLKLSIADQQTLMILQKRRASSSASSSKESCEDKEKKLFWCPHCPYTSNRRDAVDNHLNRHICVSGVQNNYTCEHCDYTVPQSHFLREHMKTHFMPPRNHQPEGYLVSSEMELTSINSNNQNESVIFKDNGDNNTSSSSSSSSSNSNSNNNNNIKNIYVNPQTGEFTEDAAAVSVTDTKEPKKSL